jgi:predicted transcriptional regulator of viral defense system
MFRARDFVDAGYSREYLRRLVVSGAVRAVRRGLYIATDFEGDEHLSLVQASKIMPRGIVCLLSALRFHQIGTQSPHQVWLALPRGANFSGVRSHRAIRFFQFSPASYRFGVQDHSQTGGTIRVYSPAKTVADCFKYRNQVGLDVAIQALRDGWRARRFTMAELTAAAEVCRVRRVLQPYLEMLT